MGLAAAVAATPGVAVGLRSGHVPRLGIAREAHSRALDHAVRRAPSVRVTLAYEDGEASASLYEAVAPVRDRLLHKLGFVESPVRAEIWRPAGCAR